MPQVVKPKSRADAGPAARGQEGGTSPVGQPQHAPARHREHQVIRFLVRHGLGDLASQEPGDRDGAGLMRLRGAQDDVTADIGEGSPDVDPTAAQVNIADAQGGCLAPAQARVAEQQDKDSPGPGCGGQLVELIVGQEDVIAPLDARQAKATCWIGADAPAAYRVIKAARCARRGPALAPGLSLGGGPGRRAPALRLSTPQIRQAHLATRVWCCALPPSSPHDCPARGRRVKGGPAGRHTRSAFADPGPGAHSPGFGGCGGRRGGSGIRAGQPQIRPQGFGGVSVRCTC